jgi:hypothetical protein
MDMVVVEEIRAERMRGKLTTDYRNEVNAARFAAAATHEKDLIIAPAIQAAFEKAVTGRGKKVILDYGMGPGYITVPFLADGHTVYGYDTSEDMVNIAKGVIREAENLSRASHLFTSDYDVLEKVINNHPDKRGADFGILSFVHPSIDTEDNLHGLMHKVTKLMADNSTVILIGANPEGLAKNHVTCQYDVKDPPDLNDGDIYHGTIYDGRGNSKFQVTDRYWSQKTLINSADSAGLRFITSETIDDKRGTSPRRPNKNGVPPFIMLTFRK